MCYGKGEPHDLETLNHDIRTVGISFIFQQVSDVLGINKAQALSTYEVNKKTLKQGKQSYRRTFLQVCYKRQEVVASLRGNPTKCV